MRVMGIDPGTALTGYGVVDQEGQHLRLVAAGAVRTSPERPAGERLFCLYRELQQVILAHRPEAMAVEKLFFNRNVRTAMAVGEARGVVLLAAAQAKLPVAEYTPPAVKLAVTGVGSAGKHQVGVMVARLLNLTAPPTPDDVADALAVAICHLHQATTQSRLARARALGGEAP